MTNHPQRADQVARELWTAALQHSDNADNVLLVADELLTRLDGGLRRWIGAEGYAALLNRSVALTLPHSPALSRFPDLDVGATELLPAAPRPAEFSASETADAIIALLVVMMEQLGSIVGADMAVRLVALSGVPSTRGFTSHDSNDTPS